MGKSQPNGAIIPAERVDHSILLIRGQKVMLDSDLALIYAVTVKRLNEAVRRNSDRFPSDFMFRLTALEFDTLRSQFATSSSWGGRRYPPYAFTEHGAVMLAAVLNSPVAVQASVQVVRAFVRLRQMLASHQHLRHKLEELGKKYDHQFAIVFDAIRQLMPDPDPPPRPRIGYQSEKQER